MQKNAILPFTIAFAALLFLFPGCKDEAVYTASLHPQGEFANLPAKPRQELMDFTKDVLRKRLISSGIEAKNFTITEMEGVIEIKVMALDEDNATDWLDKLLTIPGNFHIAELYNREDVIGSILSANAYLAQAEGDSAGEGTLLNLIKMASYQPSENEEFSPTPIIGFAFPSDTSAIFGYLNQDSVKAILPTEMKIMGGIPVSDSLIPLIAVREHYSNESLPILTKNFVQNISVTPASEGIVLINLEFNKNGGEYFYELTLNNFRQFLGIVLDGKIIHYAMLQGGISEGKISILSPYDFNHTRAIGAAMRYSSLPFPLTIEGK